MQPHLKKGLSFMKHRLMSVVFTSITMQAALLAGCGKSPDTANDDSTQQSANDQHSANQSADKQNTTQADEEQIIRPALAMRVGVAQLNNQHRFNGMVKAGKESSLSFRVAGNVRNLRVKIGDYVHKGQRLAQLDATDYHVGMSQALANQKNVEASKQAVHANIKQAQAELIRARSAYVRAEKLYETDTIAISEFEQAKAAWQAAAASSEATQLQFSSAAAQVEAATQQVYSARNQLAYTQLLAPFSGVISQVMVEENEQIGAGQAVVILSNDTQTEIEVGLPASIIASVKRGDPVKAQFFNLPDQEFTGTVSEVGFSTGSSAVYPVIIKLHQAGTAIRPGMSADVTFLGSKENTAPQIIIPATAIGDDKDGKFVYKLSPTKPTLANNGKKHTAHYTVSRQPVTLGKMSSKGFIITNGLAVDDLIAKSGLNVMQEGDVVTLFNNSPPESSH